jgi:hypothetical protein
VSQHAAHCVSCARVQQVLRSRVLRLLLLLLGGRERAPVALRTPHRSLCCGTPLPIPARCRALRESVCACACVCACQRWVFPDGGELEACAHRHCSGRSPHHPHCCAHPKRAGLQHLHHLLHRALHRPAAARQQTGSGNAVAARVCGACEVHTLRCCCKLHPLAASATHAIAFWDSLITPPAQTQHTSSSPVSTGGCVHGALASVSARHSPTRRNRPPMACMVDAVVW